MQTNENENEIEQGSSRFNGPYSQDHPELDLTHANKEIAQHEQQRSFKIVTERNKDKIGKEFKYLDKLFAWGNGKPIIKECKNLNIYSDVAPFKETAVVLDGGSPEKVDASNYINACYIKSSFKERGNPFGLIIATQGPQPHTCESFWKMVIENNVTKIVTLCQNIGKDYHDDACQYFPPSGGMKYKSITVANVMETNQMEHVNVRSLLVSDGKRTIYVQHNHFKSWPDFEVPHDGSMQGFQELINDSADYVMKCHEKLEKGEPIERLLVHCKAGIGRTGTTIGLINLVTQIKLQQLANQSEITLSPFSTIRQLREQRVYMCQTDNQYEFIYDFLKEYKY